MVKKLLPALSAIIFLSSCSTFKPLNSSSNKQVAAVQSPTPKAKFIEEITVIPQSISDNTVTSPIVKSEPKNIKQSSSKTSFVKKTNTKKPITKKPDVTELFEKYFEDDQPEVEKASPVQLKYAVLMNTEVESLPSKSLLETVDEWYGVRYRTGGRSKKGVDCSGFTVEVYLALYGMEIPRVSREQYRVSEKLSTTELEEGDLVFFNTNGRGVSHVGVYLGHNKFIHASVSRGIMVNDLYENYYLKRYIGGGRIAKNVEEPQGTN